MTDLNFQLTGYKLFHPKGHDNHIFKQFKKSFTKVTYFINALIETHSQQT